MVTNRLWSRSHARGQFGDHRHAFPASPSAAAMSFPACHQRLVLAGFRYDRHERIIAAALRAMRFFLYAAPTTNTWAPHRPGPWPASSAIASLSTTR
jgi:hypothetical protein